MLGSILTRGNSGNGSRQKAVANAVGVNIITDDLARVIDPNGPRSGTAGHINRLEVGGMRGLAGEEKAVLHPVQHVRPYNHPSIIECKGFGLGAAGKVNSRKGPAAVAGVAMAHFGRINIDAHPGIGRGDRKDLGGRTPGKSVHNGGERAAIE